MAIIKTEGILLKRQEIRETSLILTAFTRDLGKIQGLVKGVRSAQGAVPGFLEPLTLQTLVLYERKRSPWMLISSCDLVDPFDPIRKDLNRTAYASFCLDMTDAMTETSDPHPEIFDLLRETLRALSQGTKVQDTLPFFEVHLLKMSGFLPNVGSLKISLGARLSLEQILKTPPQRMGRIRLSKPVAEELKDLLQRRIRSILERELKSLNFLYALHLESPPEQNGEPLVRHA